MHNSQKARTLDDIVDRKYKRHGRTIAERRLKRARVNRLAAEILWRAGQTPDPDHQPILQLAEWGLSENLGPDRPGEGFALGQYLDQLATHPDQVRVFRFLMLEDGEGPCSTDLAEELEDRKNDPREAAKFLLEYLLLHLRAAGYSVP